MKLEITTNGETTEVELNPGTVTVGGTEKDGIQIPGLSEAQLELRIDGERLMVLSTQTFTVDDVLSPPGVPRLVLAGERIGMAEGVLLRQIASAPEAEKGTAAVLKHLLSDLGDPEETRCATLTCLTGLDVGRRYPLAGDLAEIGRGEDVQVRVRDRAVSRRHARIRRSGGTYSVEDLRSPNGVFVNGKRVRAQTALADGDVLELGHSLLRFRAPIEPPAPPPPPTAAEPGPAAPAPPQGTEGTEAAGSDTAAASDTPGAATGGETSAGALGPRKVSRSRMEVALIGLGVALALIGVVVTFGMVSG